MGDGEDADPKLMELMAKQAFMKVDERTMKAFREQGKTPTLQRSSDPMLSDTQQNKKTMRQTGVSVLSPMRGGGEKGGSASIGKLGYLGTFQDVSIADLNLHFSLTVIERARPFLE